MCVNMKESAEYARNVVRLICANTENSAVDALPRNVVGLVCTNMEDSEDYAGNVVGLVCVDTRVWQEESVYVQKKKFHLAMCWLSHVV